MLVVDHYDSYTWNLVHLVAAVTGVLPEVVEHDVPGVLDRASRATHVVLSPGPGHAADPADFSVSIDNPYWPMSPGSKWVYRETDSKGTNQEVVVEVTDKTKMIANGIEAA